MERCARRDKKEDPRPGCRGCLKEDVHAGTMYSGAGMHRLVD